MVAYMNNEAFELTKKTGIAHYYSRSRAKIWRKGETSGHIQEVRAIYIDCDNDCILITVDQRVAPVIQVTGAAFIGDGGWVEGSWEKGL
jgi:phosphoribosyl-AMP cyclohydrolase